MISALFIELDLERSKPFDLPYSPSYETFEVTAYTAGKESTGKSPGDKGYGITASGERVKAKETLACPRSIPFDTEVYIPHFDDVYVCKDRGGAIKNGKLDVYMKSLSKAKRFGRRELPVLILN